MLDELRRIEEGITVGILAQQIPDTLVSLHALAPDRTPVGLAELGGFAAAIRLVAFGLDADERRRCGDETIQYRVAPSAPGKTNRRFERQRPGGPDRIRTTGQRRQVLRSVKKEAEDIDGKRSRGFGTVELAAGDLVARRGVGLGL